MEKSDAIIVIWHNKAAGYFILDWFTGVETQYVAESCSEPLISYLRDELEQPGMHEHKTRKQQMLLCS